MHEKQKALITGASSGIGKALAHLLAKEGVELLLVARNEIALYELQKELSHYVTVHISALDLTKENDVHKLVSWIRIHTPDFVFNNAGFGLYGDLISLSCQELKRMIDLHCSAVTLITQAAAEAFKERSQKGTIVNISSMLALYPCPSHAVYAATKAYINSFSEAVDYELKPLGIRVLASCPGHVVTDFRRRASDGKRKSIPHFLSLYPHAVARSMWNQARRSQGMLIIDWKYRVISWFLRCLPKHVISYFLQKNMRSMS